MGKKLTKSDYALIILAVITVASYVAIKIAWIIYFNIKF